MKKTLIIAILFSSIFAKAQENELEGSNAADNVPIPVEVMTGDKWFMFQSFLTKDFGTNNRFNLFNLINYEVDLV